MSATTTSVEKVCTVCGTDVSRAKRTKDTAGRYYCEPCAAAAVARASAARPMAPAQVTAPPPARSGVPAGPEVGPTVSEVLGLGAVAPAGRWTAVIHTPPAAEDPRVIRPGEYDCVYDDVTVTLMRLQVEPEELLMLCDVGLPKGPTKQTLLLTPTKLLFVGVSRAAGQMQVQGRRELPLADVNRISASTAPATTVLRQTHTIQIVSRSGIESWTTAFSSGPRIVAAVGAIQAGEAVRPFIRLRTELAASPTPPTFGSGRLGRFKLPKLNKRFVHEWVTAGGSLAGRAVRLAVVVVVGLVAGLVAFVLMVMVMSLFDPASSSSGPGTSVGVPAASTPGDVAPAVTVSGPFADQVSFSGWRWEGGSLVGQMRFTGDSTIGFGGCRYRVLKDDVVEDSGVLSNPDGTRGEALRVSLPYPHRDRSGLRVEIITQLGGPVPSLP